MAYWLSDKDRQARTRRPETGHDGKAEKHPDAQCTGAPHARAATRVDHCGKRDGCRDQHRQFVSGAEPTADAQRKRRGSAIATASRCLRRRRRSWPMPSAVTTTIGAPCLEASSREQGRRAPKTSVPITSSLCTLAQRHVRVMCFSAAEWVSTMSITGSFCLATPTNYPTTPTRHAMIRTTIPAITQQFWINSSSLIQEIPRHAAPR